MKLPNVCAFFFNQKVPENTKTRQRQLAGRGRKSVRALDGTSIEMNNILQNSASGAHSIEERLIIACREPAAFRAVADKVGNISGKISYPPFKRILTALHHADENQALHDGDANHFAISQLEKEAGKGDTVSSEAVRFWRDTKNQYKAKDALKVAIDAAKEIVENHFEFSTDADLDDLLGSVEWLWENYIPLGFPTLLVGEQDGGKSTVAQDFCRTLISGGQWPNGAKCQIQVEKLLWIDTEGSIALFRQRLNEWDMPRGRFIFPKDPLKEISLENGADWNWLEHAIDQFRPPLIVIDALSGAHNAVENSIDGMKPLMKKIAALSQKYKIAVLVIHHLNKGIPGADAYPLDLNRIRGSTSISQYCRSVLALTIPDKSQPDARRLDVIKLNLAKKPSPIGYVLTNNGPAWGLAPEPPKARRAVDDAIDFLREILSGKTRPTSEVEDEAKAAGIGDSALKDARKRLKVKSVKEGGSDGRWFLSLDTENHVE